MRRGCGRARRWRTLSERLGLDMEQAFELLRSQARARNRRLAELADAVAGGSEDVSGWETVGGSRSR